MAIDQKSLLDALYCEEEKWGDVVEHEDEDYDNEINDFLWEDEELESLFTKERESWCCALNEKWTSSENCEARKEAVEWILKINGHYGFSALTCVLAVNYLDRFLSSWVFTQEKPWMMQLAAVTCLSLAAKVEETHVPLLLDLQVEGTKFVFEAKTIQKMELLVLSELKWRMNPVTPLSFLDHIVRRFGFGLKSCIHWEFLTSCQNLLLTLISDPRFRLYPPSVLATSTMLHVIHQYKPCNAIHYEAQLLSLLKITKEQVGECYEMISEVLLSNNGENNNNSLKRKFCEGDESWSDEESCISSASSPPFFKKTRKSVEQERIRLPSLTTVFVDAGSPH